MIKPTGQGPVLRNLEWRLENWGEYLRNNGTIDGQADSLEGGYRSEQSKIWNPPGPKPDIPDEIDAWEVCLAVLLMPLLSQLVLKLTYVKDLEQDEIAKVVRRATRLRIRGCHIPKALAHARIEIDRILRMPKDRLSQRVKELGQRMLGQREDMLVD